MSGCQLYRKCRYALALASLLIATIASSSSFAQINLQQRGACTRTDTPAAARLSACVSIIEAAKETPSVMAVAHTVRGDSYREKKEFDQALEDYDQAIQLEAKHAPAYYGRGLIRFEKKDLDGAIKEFEQALNIDARNSSYWNARAKAYFAKLDYKSAFELD